MAAKKDWYQIKAPELFGSRVIGETITSDPKTLVGRRMESGLMDLTGDFSRYHMKLEFQVTGVEGHNLNTRFIGHDILNDQIYRMVRRHTRRVDSIDIVRTKDGASIRMKSIAILLRRVNTSIKKTTRQKMSEIIQKTCSEMTLDDIIKAMISGQIQNAIGNELRKIYPVGGVEIRKSELILREKKHHQFRGRTHLRPKEEHAATADTAKTEEKE